MNQPRSLATILDVPEGYAHFNDMLEAYAAAGGDLEEWEQFAEMDRAFGLDHAMEQSPLWRPGSARYGKNLRACADDPLATFIMMPANEILAPLVYAQALASLPRDERFGKFRRFLEAHVELDEGDHGPAFLEWLDMYLLRADIWPDRRRAATRKIQTLFGG